MTILSGSAVIPPNFLFILQAFQQFDSEGDGTADVGTMLEVLKCSSCPTLGGDLSSVVKNLQACSLTPGFIDVYNEDKQNVGQHGHRILNVRLSSTVED